MDEGERLLNVKCTGFRSKDFGLISRWYSETGQIVKAERPPFLPYMFISAADYYKLNADEASGFTAERGPYITHKGEPAMKLIAANPAKLKSLKYKFADLGIQTYEADVKYERRALIDQQLYVEIPKNVLYWDIETDSRAEFPRPHNPTQRIILFGCIDSQGNRYAICDDDETQMIHDFATLANKYEATCGWFTSGFDLPYLFARAAHLEQPLDEFRFPDYDLLKIYKRFFKKKQQSYALSAVVESICGYSIEDWGIDGTVQQMYNLFNTDRPKLINYCLKQVQAVKDIDTKLKLLDMWTDICKSACIIPYATKRGASEFSADVPGNSKIIDNLVLLEEQAICRAGQPRTVYPTKAYDNLGSASYIGGYVRQPATGLWQYVIDIDAAQQYPAIIKTFNIGLSTYCETKEPENIVAYHGSFLQTPRSTLAKIVERLSTERYKAKRERNKYHPTDPMYDVWDKIQFGKKFITNSVYGICGFPGSRYFRREIAENITSYARAIVKYASAYMSDMFLPVYGDTDSVFMHPTFEYKDVDEMLQITSQKLDSLNAALTDAIHEQWNVPRSQISVKFEYDTIFEWLYLPQKKKCYAGKVFWQNGKFIEPYTHVKGFETVRSSTLEFARTLQAEILESLLQGHSMPTILALTEQRKQEFTAGMYDSQLTYMIGLSKPIAEYNSVTATVKAATKMKECGRDVRVGDKIKFVRGANGKIILEGEEVTEEDRDAIWNSYVEPMLKRLDICETKQMTLNI